jgi:O-palmitoleoyl-L-serine hydrolase
MLNSFLIALTTFGLSVNAVTLNKHLLDSSKYPNAKCNDGTMSGFYFTAGTSNTWIIQHQGGGWCYSEASCLARSGDLISSKNWPATHSLTNGILSSTVPGFDTANKVYVYYCTSDGYIGNVSASTNNFNFEFRGHEVVSAVYSTLTNDFGMGSQPNTQVLYSGCSAGARGMLFNVQYLAKLLAANPNISRYGFLFDSGFYLDIDTFSPTATSFRDQAKGIYALAQLNTTIDPDCIAKFGQELGWKCALATYYVPFITAPYLLHSFLYDLFQLSTDMSLPSGAYPNTTQELAYAEMFRGITTQNVTADFVPQNGFQSAILPACYAHCSTEDSRWNTVQANGVTLEQAVASWFLNEATVSPLIVESCSGFNCGYNCPAL